MYFFYFTYLFMLLFFLDLSVQKYSKNDEFECIIIHVENPWRIYVVPKEHTNDYHW